MLGVPVFQLFVALSLIFGCGALLGSLMSGARPAVRSTLGRSALTAALCLPLAHALLPAWEVPGWQAVRNEAPGIPAMQPTPRQGGVFPRERPDLVSSGVNRVDGGFFGERVPAPRWPYGVLALVWCVGATLIIGRHLYGSFAVSGIVRNAAPIRGRAAHTAEAVLRSIGQIRIVVKETAAVSSPAACGIVRPVILLPPSWRCWNDATLRAVILHETAHIRRRDPLYLLISAAARALYWPHPGVWWAAHMAERQAEYACDELVLEAGSDPIEYAGALVTVGRSAQAAHTGAAALLWMSRHPRISKRVRAILEHSPRNGGLAARWATALPSLIAVIVGAASPASAIRTMPQDGGSPPIGEAVEIALRDSSRVVMRHDASGLGLNGRGNALGNPTKQRATRRPETRDQDSLLHAQLASTNPDLRLAAVARIGRDRLVTLVPHVLPLATDSSASVRWQVATAIGMIEPESGIGTVVHLLTDIHPRVRQSAAWAIGEYNLRDLPSTGAVDALARLHTDPDPGVRRQVAASLGILEPDAGVPALKQLLRDDDAAVRATSVWALGELRQRDIVRSVLALADDASPLVRRQVAQVFVHLPDASSRPVLEHLENDPDPEVRATARFALDRLGID